ncbi:hypothetical protein RRG08_057685 [Elysia crispata]|uniref:Uncharacterized protein n=1 Tax=Elysia crispata TaxID=231223 RepID=A0AAE1AES8_9GAST|nr:hypothetical protein RRG08_057685 [Elysia crispata]
MMEMAADLKPDRTPVTRVEVCLVNDYQQQNPIDAVEAIIDDRLQTDPTPGLVNKACTDLKARKPSALFKPPVRHRAWVCPLSRLRVSSSSPDRQDVATVRVTLSRPQVSQTTATRQPRSAKRSSLGYRVSPGDQQASKLTIGSCRVTQPVRDGQREGDR